MTADGEVLDQICSGSTATSRPELPVLESEQSVRNHSTAPSRRSHSPTTPPRIRRSAGRRGVLGRRRRHHRRRFGLPTWPPPATDRIALAGIGSYLAGVPIKKAGCRRDVGDEPIEVAGVSARDDRAHLLVAHRDGDSGRDARERVEVDGH